MQKLILTVIIACVAWVATAQRTTAQPASSGRTSTTTTTLAPPQSTPSTTARSTPALQLTPKSGTLRPENTNAATDRSTTTASPRLSPKATTTTSETTKDRSTTTTKARPARTTTAKKATTSHYNGSGTARTVTAPAKKAAPAKPVEPVNVKWMTLEEALEKSKTEKRKIYIDVITDWCGWCKRMDETTFTDPAVAQYLNDHFYPVKFNAEQTNEIQFNNKTYRFKNNGGRGCHELAAEWLNNRLSYPTSVFLDENLTLIQPLPGYQDGPKLEAILNYFGTDSHRTTPWETYERNFNAQQ